MSLGSQLETIMANTALQHHIVFSTKNRESWISQSIEERVWEYLCGIARHNDIFPVKIGGIDDHSTLSISKAMRLLKGGSSLWFHQTFRRSAFACQDGYGAFTVSKCELPDVICRVEEQGNITAGRPSKRAPGPSPQAWYRLRREISVG
jgi:putative transposase